jgi:hypothetical protein
MPVRILNVKTNLEIIIPTFMLDNNDNIITRIAVSLQTTKKYLFFIDGIPKSFENDIVIKVENLLETILSTDTFSSLYEDIKDKIEQQDLSIKDDIIEPFIAFNKNLEKIPPEFIGSVLLPSQIEIEKLNITNINVNDIWSRRKLIISRITSSIKTIKSNADKEEKMNREFDEIEIEENYSEFELEKLEFQVILESSKTTIMELFNNIVLTKEVPFATINYIYKVINDFIPESDWFTSLDNIIVLKFKDNKEFSNCFISIENNDEIDNSIIKLSLSATVSKQKDDIRNIVVQNILNIFTNKDNLIVKQFTDTKIKGLFYFPRKTLNKFVLSDLIMNNNFFSKLMVVDESVKASKKNESLYVHFRNEKTGEVTANISEKYSFKGDQNLRGKDIINLFPYKSYYLRIKITSIKNIESVLLFQNILSKILNLYEQKYMEVFNFYKMYIPTFGTKDEPDIVIKPPKLKDLAPEVFVNGYPPTCPHQPTIIDDSEVKDAEAEGKQVMRFPKESDIVENFLVRNYICNHESAIYPGLRSNPLSNNDMVPFLPCCYEKNHSEIQGSEYRQYYFGDQAKNKFKFQQELIITNKFVGRDTFGTIPESLDRIFNIINNNKQYMYVRMGVTDSKSSFLECILQGLYEQTGILKHKSDTARINFLKQYRKQLANNPYISICRQEMFDFNIDQIREKISDIDQYFDPKYFVSLLEKIYNCNIYVFNRQGLLLPRFEKKYFKTKTQSNINLFIYQHRGSKNERAIYDRCELIVKWNTEGQDVDYREDNNTPVSMKLKEIFRDVIKTYSFNSNIETANFNYFSDAYIGQGIDAYGKTIMIKFQYGEEEGTLLTSPMQPLPIPEIKNWTITKMNLQSGLKFLQQINTDNLVTNIVQNTINNSVENLTCNIGDIVVTIPVQSSIPIDTIQVNIVNRANNLYNKTNSLNEIFNRNKKLTRYISEYLLWLFSRMITRMRISTNLNSLLDQFVENHIDIDSSYQYPENIQKIFSIDSPLIRNNKLVVKSEEIVRRLVYHLRLQIRRNENKIRNYHLMSSIENYYVDITDFDKYEGQIMISGQDSLQNWINEKISKLNSFTNSVKVQIDTPYFFRNNLISNKIYLAQNTDSLEKAIKIATVWDNGNGINIGNNFEVEQVDKVNYTLYAYRNESEIKKYNINSQLEKTNIKIIGYKYDDYPFYTTLLSY